MVLSDQYKRCYGPIVQVGFKFINYSHNWFDSNLKYSKDNHPGIQKLELLVVVEFLVKFNFFKKRTNKGL